MIFKKCGNNFIKPLTLKKIKVSHFIPIILIEIFIVYMNIAWAQNQDDNFNYPVLYKFSSDFSNYAYRNYLSYHGTEIAPSEKKKNIVQKNTEDDTTKSDNKITIRDSQDGESALICLSLDDYDVNVKIVVYNLLGKKVLDVWNGMAIDEPCPKEYEIQKSKFPNGMYLVVAQSAKFRLVGKFIVSR